MAFIEVALSISEEQLAQEALGRLKALIEEKGIVGWEPSEADLEIIMLAVIANMASDAASIVAVVLPAIFRRYGTKLLQLAYNEGANATAASRWTVVPSTGMRTIPAGTTIEAGGVGFSVQSDTEIPPEAATVTLEVVAVERGTAYNGITGVAEQSTPLDWVTAVELVGETTGGADQETDEEYEARLASELSLTSRAPITAADFATKALNVPSGILPTGIEVGRATAIDGYNPETGTYNNGRTVTVYVTDKQGHALTTEAMKVLAEWLASFQLLNFLVFVRAATYTPVYVSYQAHILPGYSPEAVTANIDSTLLGYLNPANWGAAVLGARTWLNATQGFAIVRFNKLLGVIENVPGVDYVPPGGLAIGVTPGPTETGDLTLAGPAPLPESEAAGIVGIAI